MAEHLSQENGETIISSTKSPGKSRKMTLGSLFKRSGTDELRSSSKERGSSRSKKKKSDTTELNVHHDTHTRLTVSMETSKNDEQKAAVNIKDISLMQFKEFDDELQDPEHKSVADLSSKKVQKKNKELSKQYTQLAKSVDALKKEREELLSDKQKLKSDNKTLERDLRRSSKGEPRLSKKSSQMSVEIELETVEDMVLKIQTLEARLAERDKKLRRVRDRLQRLSSEMPDIGLPSLSPTSSQRESEIVPPMEISQNGGILDSCSVEMILDERNRVSNYKAENAELRAKVASLENNVVQLQSVIGTKEGGENKSRKRSGSIFKRGKAHSKSMVMKQSVDVVNERDAIKDSRRSKSPDLLSPSESESYPDVSDTSGLACTDPKLVGSLQSFVYAGLSPRSAAKRAHGDLQTLQSCLKAAIEEKKSLSENNEQLEAELVMVKEKIKDQNKLSEEREQSLQKLECMRDTLVREKKELMQKVSTLQSTSEQLKLDNLSLEKQHASSVTKKYVEITNLKNEIKKLKEKLEESETMRKESEDVFVPPTPQSTPKREVKVSKTVVTKPPIAPVSQTKPSAKDGESEKTRKTSQPRIRRRSSSSSIDEHFESVSNTRALFEQKIVTFKEDKQSPKRSLRKSSLTDERRGSYSNSSSSLKPIISHAKSSSFDTSNIVILDNSNRRTSPPASVKNKTVAESPSASKPTSLNIIKSDAGTTSVKSFTSTNKEISPVTKVSKIIVKSTASPTGSPVFSRQKSTDKSVNASSVFQKQTSVPATVSTVRTTSTSSTPKQTNGVVSRNMSVDSKKDAISTTSSSVFQKQTSVPATVSTVHTTSTPKKTNGVVSRNMSVDSKKDAMSTASSAKRTIVSSPVKANSVILTTTSGTNGLSSASKVTVTTTNTNTNTDFIRRNPRNQPRPQSVLLVPTSFSIHKANSLQNIPEKTSSESTIAASPSRSTPTGTTVPAPQQSPVARRFQRRDRNERPKTMYAGKAETTNLVNLISRFQQQEPVVKKSENTSKFPPATVTIKTPQINVLSPATQTTKATPTTKTTPSPPPATGVVLRNSTSRAPRPKTYYGAPNEKLVDVKPPSSPVSYKKPPPSERPLQRAQTVGAGLGFNRQSKKAMLLRWCQREIKDYDNVHLQNFDSSFSDGMAFCALMHHFIPDKIPYSSLSPKNREHNFTLAFNIAEEAGIPSLLDVEDMVQLSVPDWMSVMTYVSFIYNKFGQPNST